MFKDYYQFRDWVESFIPQTYTKSELGLERIEELLKRLGNPEKKFKSIHVAGTSGKGSTAFYTARLLLSHPVILEGSSVSRRPIRELVSRKLEIGPKTFSRRDSIASLRSLRNDKKRYFKVGLHVSPHLVDIRERMQVLSSSVIPAKAGIQKPAERWIPGQARNDQLMPMGRFLQLANEIGPVVEAIRGRTPNLTPSYFEILVAMSFLYFAKEKVDWAVVEVGLGGRLDATNVLIPDVSVITNIGLDHTDILGDSTEKIAYEKAGIIKRVKESKSQRVKGIPVVTAAKGEALEVIKRVAKEKGARVIVIPNTKYQIPNTKYCTAETAQLALTAASLAMSLRAKRAISGSEARLSLRGVKRRSNLEKDRFASLAMTAKSTRGVELEGPRLTPRVVEEAFSVGFPGRFEEIEPGVILDGAHNPDKIKSLINFVKNPKVSRKGYFLSGAKGVTLVLAFKTGKNWKAMIDLLINHLHPRAVIATKFNAVTDTGKGSAVEPEEIRQYLISNFKFQIPNVKCYENSQEAVWEIMNTSVIARSETTKQSEDKIAAGSRNLRNDKGLVVTGSLYLVGEVRTIWKLPEA